MAPSTCGASAYYSSNRAPWNLILTGRTPTVTVHVWHARVGVMRRYSYRDRVERASTSRTNDEPTRSRATILPCIDLIEHAQIHVAHSHLLNGEPRRRPTTKQRSTSTTDEFKKTITFTTPRGEQKRGESSAVTTSKLEDAERCCGT